jgi:beta-glucanase (GH16 family)
VRALRNSVLAEDVATLDDSSSDVGGSKILMKTVFPVLLVLACLIEAIAHAQLAADAAAAPQPRRALGQVTVFFDDFSGSELDRSKWNVEVTRDLVFNNEQQAYVDSKETVYLVDGPESAGAENGALVIQAKVKPGNSVEGLTRKLDFVSGRINTLGKVEFCYGTAAARMKLPLGCGLWPAFWALGDGQWPDAGEIDVMESVGEPDWTSVALHGTGYSGETPLISRNQFPEAESAAAWHVYSVDWSPRELVFRVDDRAVYRVTRAMVEHYGDWKFDSGKYLILNLAVGGAYPEKANGVQRPYPGLPETTLERIKAGEAKVLVDWVRVTKNRREIRCP